MACIILSNSKFLVARFLSFFANILALKHSLTVFLLIVFFNQFMIASGDLIYLKIVSFYIIPTKKNLLKVYRCVPCGEEKKDGTALLGLYERLDNVYISASHQLSVGNRKQADYFEPFPTLIP